MRSVVLICVLAGFLTLMFSCGDVPDTRKEDPPPKTPPIALTAKQQQDKKLEDAKKAADQETDPQEKLKKEIAALKLERDVASRDLNAATVMLGTKETELDKMKLQARQEWLYAIAGAIFLASVVLAALAIYFRSGKFAWAAVIAFGTSCFVATAAWLVDYLLYIAIGGASIFLLTVGILVVMMLRRDRALVQLTKGVNAIKSKVPDYKEIIGDHIEDAEDKLIDSIRRRWSDASLKK